MKKFVLFVVTLSLLFTLVKKPVQAEVGVSGSSANLNYPAVRVKEVKTDSRPLILKNFLIKYNSPLIPFTDEIISLADKYNIDWKLVVAIAGVESTFCKAIPCNSYNCWGWNNGRYGFLNYSDALQTVSKTLSLHYYNQGLDTPEAIGPVYAPPSVSWAGKVRFFMGQMPDSASSTFLAEQFSI